MNVYKVTARTTVRDQPATDVTNDVYATTAPAAKALYFDRLTDAGHYVHSLKAVYVSTAREFETKSLAATYHGER